MMAAACAVPVTYAYHFALYGQRSQERGINGLMNLDGKRGSGKRFKSVRLSSTNTCDRNGVAVLELKLVWQGWCASFWLLF